VEAVPAIVALLGSSSAVVRSTAAHALAVVGVSVPDRVGPALVDAFRDPEPIVRSEAIDAVGVVRYAAAVQAVMTVLRTDPDAVVRAAAAESLGDLGDSRALAELERALEDPDEAVRGYAAASLGLLGTPALLPKLRSRLDGEDSARVKAEFYAAGYRLGATEDLARLLRLLDTADETLATVIVNIVDDLTARTPAASLRDEAMPIHRALTAAGTRFAILRSHVAEVLTRLPAGRGAI
jgi:HEAT repeat protein